MKLTAKYKTLTDQSLRNDVQFITKIQRIMKKYEHYSNK